jgi:hypothetical protein
METTNIKENIIKTIKESVFSKQGYEVSLFFENFEYQLLKYINVYENENITHSKEDIQKTKILMEKMKESGIHITSLWSAEDEQKHQIEQN